MLPRLARGSRSDAEKFDAEKFAIRCRHSAIDKSAGCNRSLLMTFIDNVDLKRRARVRRSLMENAMLEV